MEGIFYMLVGGGFLQGLSEQRVYNIQNYFS